MPASPLRRRIFAAVVVAIVLPVGLSGCGVVENLQSAGEDLQRQIGEALGGGESVSDDGDTDIYTLVTGDCIDDTGIDPAKETVASIDAADCDTPHDSEVIGRVQILGSDYPGDDETVLSPKHSVSRPSRSGPAAHTRSSLTWSSATTPRPRAGGWWETPRPCAPYSQRDR